MKQWYVIKTKPKREKLASALLSQVGFEVFLPLIQGVTEQKPLFPSYIFIHADFESNSQLRLVQYCRGVSYVLGDQKGPLSLIGEIISMLREQTRDGSLIEQELLLKEGDSVRVKRGLFADLVGIIEKHVSAEQRVQILFKWFSTSMRAVVKYRDLERAA